MPHIHRTCIGSQPSHWHSCATLRRGRQFKQLAGVVSLAQLGDAWAWECLLVEHILTTQRVRFQVPQCSNASRTVNLMRIYWEENRGSSIAKMHASEASSCVWHFCHSWRSYRVQADHFTRYQSLNDPWKTKHQLIFLQVHCLDSFSSVRRSLNISKPRFETSCLQKLNWSSHSPEYTLRRCPFSYLCNWGIHLRTQAALRLLPGA